MDTSLEKQKRLAHVARKYYIEDQKQSDIARDLGVSRPLISRMLSEARELGIVEITIHEPGAREARLLERLRLTSSIRGGVLVEEGTNADATNRLLSQGAVELLRQREAATHTKGDIHETDSAYLAACRGAALEAGQLYGWKRLSCLDEGGALRDVEEIHKEIWQAVRPLLSGRET